MVRHWWSRWLGDRGERYAARFLRKQGFRILARNYSSQFGEIDLIAVDGETLVFVEVKTRKSDVAGTPDEAVDLEKQRKITRTAWAYIKQHKLHDQRTRFDVVSLIWPDDARQPDIRHFRNAFPPVE